MYGILISFMTLYVIDYAITSSLPLYLSNVLNFEIGQNGLTCSLPWFCCFLGALAASHFADHLRQTNRVTTTVIRKTNQLIAATLPAAFLTLAGYSGCQSSLVVFFLSLAMFFFAFHYAGACANCLDLAPEFSGTIFAIANTFGSLPGILTPLLVDKMTQQNVHSKILWLRCFYVLAAISISGGLAFLVLGSGNVQPWGNPQISFREEKQSSDKEMKRKKSITEATT